VEKYAEYQRKHVLRLNKSSFKGSVSHPVIQELTSSLPSIVRTSVIESRLREIAQNLGIRIVTGFSVSDIHETIQTLGVSPGIVVGADGSHSHVRREVFGGLMAVHDSLQHIVDVKYEVYGDAKQMSFLNQVYPTLKLMSFVAEEHVGTNTKSLPLPTYSATVSASLTTTAATTNTTTPMSIEVEATVATTAMADRSTRNPVTLRLIVDRDTGERLKDATFKSPYQIPTHRDRIPQSLINEYVDHYPTTVL